MKKQKKRGSRRRSTLRMIFSYIFLWPALRNYLIIWHKYFKHKKQKGKREKVVIIED